MIEPIVHQHGSSGMVLPAERSIKQRNFAYCANPQCAENGREFHFEVEHDLFCCPKCGANRPPVVGMLAKIHLIVQDPRGQFEGVGGIRYRIACDTGKKRESVSTITNHEVGTGDITACNCVDCLAEAKKINAANKTGLLIYS